MPLDEAAGHVMDDPVEVRLTRLEDEAAIRTLLSQYGRAIDRLDADLLASLFHEDADIHYGPDVFEGNAIDFIPAVLAIAGAMRRSQHLLGQMVIDIAGTVAWAETYGQAAQMVERDGTLIEFMTGSRYIDRLEKRHGIWRIASRQVVVDWLRELQANEALFGLLRGPPVGRHSSMDPVYARRAAEPPQG